MFGPHGFAINSIQPDQLDDASALLIALGTAAHLARKFELWMDGAPADSTLRYMAIYVRHHIDKLATLGEK